MKKITLFWTVLSILFSFCAETVFSQMNLISNSGIKTEGNLYVEKGIVYTDAIVVNFKEKVIDLPAGIRNAVNANIVESYTDVKEIITNLETDYGALKLAKQIPNAKWGDTYRTHKKNGTQVKIHDYSQLFTVKFTTPAPLKETLEKFRQLEEVEFAHEPVSIVFHDAPNDPDYESSLQWNLAAVNAEGAWELTHGSSSVKIGIVDEGIEAHPDLLFGGNTFPGDHGTWVAGVAGARTDNETGIASLGWGVSIYNYGGPFEIGDHEFMAERILDAIDDGMDIINMSWGTLRYVVDENDYVSLCPNCSGSALSKWLVVVNAGYIVVTHSYPEISYAISDAHELGIICISSAGNSSKNPQNNPNEEDCDPMWPPFDDYPSKYLGVIGVSATWLLNDNEEYIPNWNYGDYVDISAPGYNIWTTDTSSGYTYKNGTSFSAPLVSALTGLIITLDPNENVFEILKNSTDKVDSDNHPYDGNGWNQYLGYGRINAYKALKAVFPNPPNNLTLTGSVGGHPTIHWDANVEPDLDGYNIYSNYDGGSYQYLTSVDKYTTSFTDPGAIVGGGKFAPSVCYKVSAFDVAGNESDLPWRATCTKVSGISKQSAEDCDDCIPIQTVLHNAYPNPFNPKTNISFDLKNDSFVNLSVYNIKGQIVSTLVNSSTPAGYHHIPFRGDHLPSGVYIYKVVVKSAESNSNYQAIKRMLLLK